MRDKILVSNIQRFSLHDGPGIRTTVFLKGCSLRCPWCANPETINNYPEGYTVNGFNSVCGQYMSSDEVFNVLIRDYVFYKNGGVTFSGGEPLLQMSECEPLIKKLKAQHINICFETALFAPCEDVKTMLKYADFVYVDIKMLDYQKAHSVLNADLRIYLTNLDVLVKSGVPFKVRMPLINHYTNGVDNIEKICSLLKQYNIYEIELLREHHMGLSKYDSLNIDRPTLIGISDKEVEDCVSLFRKNDINAHLLQI